MSREMNHSAYVPSRGWRRDVAVRLFRRWWIIAAIMLLYEGTFLLTNVMVMRVQSRGACNISQKQYIIVPTYLTTLPKG